MTRHRRHNLVALAASALLGSAVAAVVWPLHAAELPAGALDPSNVRALRIFDRNGALLREVISRPDGRAHWVPLSKISRHLVDATLVGEDKRFFDHDGVDRVAIARAAGQLVARRRIVSGASTLTMQLVRIVDPASRGRSLWTKLRQLVLARRIEARLSKREILWQYLNRVPYGRATFGAQAAARRYFHKPAAALSLAEAAALAALPRSPRGYDPFRPRGRARLIARQRFLLRAMHAEGRIAAEALRIALGEPLRFLPAKRPFRAPHLSTHLAALRVARDASALHSTIDLPLQREVEIAAARTVKRLADHGVTNAAVLVVDNRTAEVTAYVGSARFDDAAHSGQIDGTRALRQPGSALKPFTYAMALEQGMTVATLLDDLPVHFTTDSGAYAPRNYDRRFRGPVRLAVALASSLNVPAVRVAEYVGVPALLRRLRDAGFSTLDKTARHYGLGLTLGNGEVSLQQLAAAYTALANGGRYRPLRLWRRARDHGGRTVRPGARASRRVVGPSVAYLVSKVLSDPLARLTGFGRDTPLDVGFPAAVKTGTSKDFRDNWTIGYSRDVTVAVWVGNFDGRPMRRVSGITGAGPLWAEIMRAAQRRYGRDDPADFARPRDVLTRRVCPRSGQAHGPHCPASVEVEMRAHSPAPRPCTLHREVSIDRRNGLLAGPSCPQRHVDRRAMLVYPPKYRAWAHGRGITQAPTQYSPRCPDGPTAKLANARSAAKTPAKAARRVSIRFPAHGDSFTVDPDLRRRYQQLPLEATVHGAAAKVRWLVNGRAVASAAFPYSASWPLRRGTFRVQAVLPGGAKSRVVRITVR